MVGSANHAYAYLENPGTGLRLVTRVGVEASSGIFNGRYTTEVAVPEARSSDKRGAADLADPARRGEKVLAVGQDAEAAFATINDVVSRLTSKLGYSVLNDNSNAAIALGLNEADIVPDIDSNTNRANTALSRLTKDGSELDSTPHQRRTFARIRCDRHQIHHKHQLMPMAVPMVWLRQIQLLQLPVTTA